MIGGPVGTIADRIQALSDHLVGTEATYEGTYRKRTKNVSGTITGIEFGGCSITNARGQFIGVRLCIKPKGKRPVWTWVIADEWTDCEGGGAVA